MRRRSVFLTLLLFLAAPAYAEETTFPGAMAAALLASCSDKTDWHQGYCAGFIEAIALRLADSREFCAYWPVNRDLLVSEAKDALAEAEKNALGASSNQGLN
jgi:hypothetical protein